MKILRVAIPMILGFILLFPAATVVAQEGPPAGYVGPVATRPEYLPGDRSVYLVSGDRENGIRTYVMIEDRSPWNGLPASRHRVEETGRTEVYDADMNWMATLDNDGSVLTSATPGNGNYSWPLWIGKRWRAFFAYHDSERGRTWNRVGVEWTVEAFEEVTVAAGTFMAFRLESTPGDSNATTSTRWYAPEIGSTVRLIRRRSSTRDRGAERRTRELVEYSFAG